MVGNNESKKDLSSSSSELFLKASKNSSSNASVFCFLGPVFFFLFHGSFELLYLDNSSSSSTSCCLWLPSSHTSILSSSSLSRVDSVLYVTLKTVN